jgi:dihydroflavonol-4-reductase
LVATADKYADQVWQTNVEGTMNVIDQALAMGIKRIVHVSSITALFNPKAREVNENSPPGHARNAYGRSKVACEKYVRGLQEGGAPVKITYPTGTIGPYDPGLTEPMRGLRLFLTSFTVVTTTGIQYVDVRDVADAHVQLLEAEPKADRYMLGGVYHRWYELVDLLEEITGRTLLRLHMIPPVLTWLGKTMDAVTQFTGIEGPFTEGAAEYAIHWSIAINRKIEEELGFEFRDPKETIEDAMIWMYEVGWLEDRHMGDLLEE